MQRLKLLIYLGLEAKGLQFEFTDVRGVVRNGIAVGTVKSSTGPITRNNANKSTKCLPTDKKHIPNKSDI